MSASKLISNGALVCVLLFASCNPENKVFVKERNFGDEIEIRQNLSFTFNRELVPDSVLNIWDTTAYLTFTPGVKGAYKWISRKELIFSPASSFQPATEYTTALTHELTRFSRVKNTVDDLEKIKFHSPFLKIESSNGWWSVSKEEPGNINLNIAFQFNYHIEPAVISRFLELKVNGSVVPFELNENMISPTLKIHSAPMSKQLIDGSTVEYTFKAGAGCPSCGMPVPIALTGKQEIKAPDKLEITHVEGILDNGTGLIKVYCNQEINSKDIAKLISISPSVNFSVEQDGNGFNISAIFEAGGSYQLNISKALTGVLGGAMEKDFTALVPFGEMEPSIGFVSNKGGYMSTHSSRK